MGRGRSIFWAVVYFTDLSMCAKFQGLSQRLHFFTHSWPPALTSAMPYLLEPKSLSLTLCGVLWTLPHVSSVTQESSTMAWLKSALTVIRRARRSIKLWSAGTVLRMLIMRYKLQEDFLRLLICYDMLIYMIWPQKSQYIRNGLTDLYEIWYAGAKWVSLPHRRLKHSNFTNPRWRTAAILRTVK